MCVCVLCLKPPFNRVNSFLKMILSHYIFNEWKKPSFHLSLGNVLKSVGTSEGWANRLLCSSRDFKKHPWEDFRYPSQNRPCSFSHLSHQCISFMTGSLITFAIDGALTICYRFLHYLQPTKWLWHRLTVTPLPRLVTFLTNCSSKVQTKYT